MTSYELQKRYSSKIKLTHRIPPSLASDETFLAALSLCGRGRHVGFSMKRRVMVSVTSRDESASVRLRAGQCGTALGVPGGQGVSTLNTPPLNHSMRTLLNSRLDSGSSGLPLTMSRISCSWGVFFTTSFFFFFRFLGSTTGAGWTPIAVAAALVVPYARPRRPSVIRRLLKVQILT